MTSRASLAGKTLFITGATRGIGRAIALRAAEDGARVAIIGKTAEAHPTLPETVFSTAEAVRSAGGEALACVADVRSDEAVAQAVQATVDRFGGIDIVVNNASAIALAPTSELSMARFDLMHQVNTRATFLCVKTALPYLKQAPNPHILTLSPPPALRPDWIGPHVGYTLSKYGMSLCTIGFAAELRPYGIAVNSLWPVTTIDTAALRLLGDDTLPSRSRSPRIMADAAHAIVTTEQLLMTGQCLFDEDVLRGVGTTDFSGYSLAPEPDLATDLFVPESVRPPPRS